MFWVWDAWKQNYFGQEKIQVKFFTKEKMKDLSITDYAAINTVKKVLKRNKQL